MSILCFQMRFCLAAEKKARERVLEVAEQLFYREGVRAVGIDAIIARSGVAKMSLYRNFASKDALIVAYLEARDRRFFDRWDRAVGADDVDPCVRVNGLIAATIERVRQPGYRGCPFLNTSAEFPDPTHPARAVINCHNQEVRERLLRICGGLNIPKTETLVTQLIVLMDGIYASAAVLTDDEAAAVLGAANALVLAQITRPSDRGRTSGSHLQRASSSKEHPLSRRRRTT
jgi:AcrR family transcriptional regulator